MGKGPPPAWNARDCRFDHLVAAAIAAGYGVVMTYAGMADIDRAQDVRRGIYRCANHRHLTAHAGRAAVGADEAGIGLQRERNGTYTLRYRVVTKSEGRRAHLQRRGTDRAAWPYDPRRPATAGERESWAHRDELGQPVTHD